MRNIRMRNIVTSLVGVVCLLVAGLMSFGGTAQASGGSLTWVMDEISWPTLDPAQAAFRGTDQPISSMIYGNLFTVGKNNTYEPGLATSYKLSSNGLMFTMNLRPGVKFQDGTPFNAAAVKDSLERDLSPKLECSCLSFLQPVKSITTPSNLEVQLHFSRPDGTILAALSGSSASYVPSPTAVAKEGANFGESPVGAGPFKVTNNAVDSSMTLTSWPGYWDSKDVHAQSIHIIAESDGPSEWATLESGGAQILSLPFGDPTVEKEAQADSSLTVQSALGYGGLVYLNPGKAPFNNLKARQALQYATDAPSLSSSLYFDLEPATEQLAGAGQAGYPGNDLPNYPSYNLAKAKSLVKQVGGLSFALNAGNTPPNVQEAEALTKEWAAAGIKATIDEQSATAGIAALQAANFQGALSAYASEPDSVGSLSNVIACPSLFNPKFCDQQVNKDLSAAEQTPNLSQQARLVGEAEERAIVNDAAFIPLVEVPEVTIAQKSVSGLVVAGTQVYAAGVTS
jgi:peptide/nickel transport system substrate-binding protein